MKRPRKTQRRLSTPFGLSLLLAMAGASAAPLHTNTAQETIMTRTAFFYDQPTVLDREQHKSLRLRPLDARFAAQAQAVPLLLAEFPQAALEYPIVFSKGADGVWVALALTGLQASVNAFVGEDGQWGARYVPASVRRYPFILVENGTEQFSVAIDLAATQNDGEGEPLFDDAGEPSALTRGAIQMLSDFQQQAKQTQALAAELEQAGLLSQQNLQVRLDDGRQAAVEGVWIIDEAKLRALSDTQVLAWFRGGQLGALHAHMLSLRNLVNLLERTPKSADAALVQ